MARIMLADDASFMRLVLREILTAAGHTVVAEAENGIDAVKIYMAVRPELLVLDITMPFMDGLRALREIRSRDSDARVLMCSAMGQKRMVEEAMQLGAVGFVVKPFDRQKVLDEINSVLGVR
ncbi:MAG: response regulator [Negativicutes bacterium]|nr:response regulator [Negativicutes bacterium]